VKASGADKPNILLIVADDLGCAEGCYHGSRTPTPNLDHLLRQGVESDRRYVTHVPVIVAAPGEKPRINTGLVDQVDISPTVAAPDGLESSATLQGRSITQLLAAPTPKQDVFSTMVLTHTKLIGHNVLTNRFR
jgi:arylsulfatase A-like enzyme